MRVFRGRAKTTAGDREVTERLLALAATGEPAVRVWVPHRQVAFGRRDARLEGYDRARVAARESGFSPIERRVGGQAVAYDGKTSVAFARAEPVADLREGLGARYDRVTRALETALTGLGVETVRGEPPNSFCPGSHSLSVASGGTETTSDDADGKLVGIAQRVTTDAALVAGILIVDREGICPVLEDVYAALEVPFDPSSVGSLVEAGGPADSARVVRALEEALVDGERSTVESVGQ